MATLEQLCIHPERNSSSILRADILRDTATSSSSKQTQAGDSTPEWSLDLNYAADLIEKRRLRRKLLPRKPNIDKPLEQDCVFLTSQDPSENKASVVLLPDVQEERDVPFYHPILRKLAFEYRPSPQFRDGDDVNTVAQGIIRISALPFLDSSSSGSNIIHEALSARVDSGVEVNKVLPQRTIRTCMHLLETLYKHAWGGDRGYEKRVIHDVSRSHCDRDGASSLMSIWNLSRSW
jgi:tRNASer (uridine44-2'-O)-methyltransferase